MTWGAQELGYGFYVPVEKHDAFYTALSAGRIGEAMALVARHSVRADIMRSSGKVGVRENAPSRNMGKAIAVEVRQTMRARGPSENPRIAETVRLLVSRYGEGGEAYGQAQFAPLH